MIKIETMEQQTSVAIVPASRSLPQIRRQRTPAPEFPTTRGGEPKSVGQLMQPFMELAAHPDRNRIIANLFRDFDPEK